jgi:hypothetical protein
MSGLERVTITLNSTNFEGFQIKSKCYLELRQVARAVGMSVSYMVDLGYAAHYDEKVEFSGPQTFRINGHEIDLIEVSDVTKYWALAAVQGDSETAWGFLEAALDAALTETNILTTEPMDNYFLETVKSYKLYLVSFPEASYEECESFLVVASTPDEVEHLTPNMGMNRHYGLKLGYRFGDKKMLEYGPCKGRREVTLLGDASPELEWGDVPIASYAS